MNTIIRTPLQLQQAQADAWVYGLIFCGIALALAIAIAFIINWRSLSPRLHHSSYLVYRNRSCYTSRILVL